MKSLTLLSIPFFLGLTACAVAPTPTPPLATLTPDVSAVTTLGTVTPTAGHPRLWLNAEDLQSLRAKAVDSNPLFKDGLTVLATRAKADMDSGKVPGKDTGGRGWEEYPTEMYAELFAFMSLLSTDDTARADYARRARSLLMYVMNRAAQGPAQGQPFRDPDFAADTSDRSRWTGEAFPLTVDWIYPYLSREDKTSILKVWLRWADDIVKRGYHHPEPVGLLNDPQLLSDKQRARAAANNYYLAHMRNLGLMALALDPADDPGNRLGSYLNNATGARLYMIDDLLRHDARGGLSPEGLEYGPQSLGYIAQFLLALHTAGKDTPTVLGPQVILRDNPFWNELIPALFHSFSPSQVTNPDYGTVYEAAFYADAQDCIAPDFIQTLGPLGLYDRATGNTARLEAASWIEVNMSPGGKNGLIQRIARANTFRDAILYFMLLDPVAEPADPRPNQPLNLYAQGLGHVLSRTSWGTDAAWFNFNLGWISFDHQHGEGGGFQFYRQGEWLTKEWTGYATHSSDYHNTIALENDKPIHDESYRHEEWTRGSQWTEGLAQDGHILAQSFGQGFVYAAGDIAPLYNSDYEKSTAITLATRSIVWLQPDWIIVHDHAASKTAGRFKRFWLNLPARPSISGQVSTMTTAKQQLFVTTLLPAGAQITSDDGKPFMGDPAKFEPMQFRLRVEAMGGPTDVRFLNVLQGANTGVGPTPVALVQVVEGSAYEGALVGHTAVLFPVNLGTPFTGITFTVPTSTTGQLITGLVPNGAYDVITQTMGSRMQVTAKPGSTVKADSGGVLAVGTLTP